MKYHHHVSSLSSNIKALSNLCGSMRYHCRIQRYSKLFFLITGPRMKLQYESCKSLGAQWQGRNVMELGCVCWDTPSVDAWGCASKSRYEIANGEGDCGRHPVCLSYVTIVTSNLTGSHKHLQVDNKKIPSWMVLEPGSFWWASTLYRNPCMELPKRANSKKYPMVFLLAFLQRKLLSLLKGFHTHKTWEACDFPLESFPARASLFSVLRGVGFAEASCGCPKS